MKIGILAGEASGDLLGAALMAELNSQFPEENLEFVGLGGPQMRAAGCQCWYDLDVLNVVGLIEVLKDLPRLLQLRRKLITQFLAEKIDLFIGVDQQELNLSLAYALKKKGIPTVQYVGPSVWAWRPKRIKRIKAAIDLMLCLFPFELDFYQMHDQPAAFVGHPFASQIPLGSQQKTYRAQLGIDDDVKVIAVLPGSRDREIKMLASIFFETAQAYSESFPETQFVIASNNQHKTQLLQQFLQPNTFSHRIVEGGALAVMGAADAVLVASGTATLEAMLLKKPMVIAYRVHPLTYRLLTYLVKTPYIGLPNILAKKLLVPEYIQTDVTVPNLLKALSEALDPANRTKLEAAFLALHQTLLPSRPQSAGIAIRALLMGLKQDDQGIV